MDDLSLFLLSLDNEVEILPTMTFFPKLPPELRNIVWTFAAMEPEIFSVCFLSLIPQFMHSVLSELTTTRSRSEDRSRNLLQRPSKRNTSQPSHKCTLPTKQALALSTATDTISHTRVSEQSQKNPGLHTSRSDHTKSSCWDMAPATRFTLIPSSTCSISTITPLSSLTSCGNV